MALMLAAHMLSPCVASAEDEKGFHEVYALAKARDPLVGKAGAKVDAGSADQDIAWSAILPRINANAGMRRMWHTVLNSNDDQEGSYEGYNYSIGGQLPIFTAPSYFQISAANSGFRSAEAGLTAAQQDLIVRVVQSYVALLKAQTDEKLYRDELARVSKILSQAEAFLKAGTGDVIAVYEAKARMDSAAADLVKAQAQRSIAEQNLASLAGVNIKTVKDIPVTTPLGPDPNDMVWWMNAMEKENPGLRKVREDLKQAESISTANRAGHLPTFQLQGGYTVDKGSTYLPKVETKQWYVGVNVSLPIYSGGETWARTKRAVAAESEQRYILADAQDQSTKRLKEAFLNLQYNVSIAEAYKRKYESAGLQLKATAKGREIGTRTAIDLLNAEQTFATSNRDFSHAMYDNLLRRLELKAAAGLLAESDLHPAAEKDKK